MNGYLSKTVSEIEYVIYLQIKHIEKLVHNLEATQI